MMLGNVCGRILNRSRYRSNVGAISSPFPTFSRRSSICSACCCRGCVNMPKKWEWMAICRCMSSKWNRSRVTRWVTFCTNSETELMVALLCRCLSNPLTTPSGKLLCHDNSLDHGVILRNTMKCKFALFRSKICLTMYGRVVAFENFAYWTPSKVKGGKGKNCQVIVGLADFHNG